MNKICSALSPVSTRMGDRLQAGIRPWYVMKPTSSTLPCIPPGSLIRVPALIGWGKGGNVTSVGWQVTLCDPVWHTSFRSCEANCCELLYPVTYLQNIDRCFFVTNCPCVCLFRLDTDMLLAGRCGLHSLLVLTGFSTMGQVEVKKSSSWDDDWKQVPDFYLPSIGDLAPFLG